jgi:hypothetical protein
MDIVPLGDQGFNLIPNLKNVQRAGGECRYNCHNQTDANQHGWVTSIFHKLYNCAIDVNAGLCLAKRGFRIIF